MSFEGLLSIAMSISRAVLSVRCHMGPVLRQQAAGLSIRAGGNGFVFVTWGGACDSCSWDLARLQSRFGGRCRCFCVFVFHWLGMSSLLCA